MRFRLIAVTDIDDLYEGPALIVGQDEEHLGRAGLFWSLYRDPSGPFVGRIDRDFPAVAFEGLQVDRGIFGSIDSISRADQFAVMHRLEYALVEDELELPGPVGEGDYQFGSVVELECHVVGIGRDALEDACDSGSLSVNLHPCLPVVVGYHPLVVLDLDLRSGSCRNLGA